MPSKPTPKPAVPESQAPPEELGPPQLPGIDAITAQLLGPPLDATKPPVVFEPATDDENEDEPEQDAAEPVAQALSNPSRRRFLMGAAAGLAAGVAAAASGAASVSAEAATPLVPPLVPPAVDIPPVSPQDLGAMMQTFMQLMAERDEKLMARVEAKLSAIRLPEPNGTGHSSAAELAAPPGQYPLGFGHTVMAQAQAAAETTAQAQAQAEAARVPPRMVAFIPKEDAYNPKQTVFKTWTNGRELRSKRGQVMILTLGHGVDLARNGHGNCVDIAAMQGVGAAPALNVQPYPTLARPDNWDGLPLSAQSSFPVAAAV